jgi:hypothetical protein
VARRLRIASTTFESGVSPSAIANPRELADASPGSRSNWWRERAARRKFFLFVNRRSSITSWASAGRIQRVAPDRRRIPKKSSADRVRASRPPPKS